MDDASSFVELSGVGKLFSGFSVLSGVDLHIRAGEVHAIVGENGAGKSTLGKIIGGVYRPDAGTMRINGVPVRFRTPAAALDHGITVMQQEIALAPDLTVVENVLLGREPRRLGFLDRRAGLEKFAEVRATTGFDLPADAIVGELPLAMQQQVEILRALAREAQLIVMDEPTAALPAADGARLRQVVRMLRDRGVAIVYVSHFLEETLELSDTVTVLRNGRLVDTTPAAQWTVGGMVTAMLGRSLAASYPTLKPTPAKAATRLEVIGLGDDVRLREMNLKALAGEIIGLFGLVGSGRSELAHAMFGASPYTRGDIFLDGEPYVPVRPANALARGVALLPESRKDQGLFLHHSKRRNAVASGVALCARLGFVRRERENTTAKQVLSNCAVDTSDLNIAVDALSGGNQQKVLLAKTLYRGPGVLILDEPTRGIDIGARRAIYDTLLELVSRGMAVVLISSDIEEVHQMSHRLYVIREGRTVVEFISAKATHADILNAAFGVSRSGASARQRA